MSECCLCFTSGSFVLSVYQCFWLFKKRSVMITQEMCPIRAEISTHKHLGKCIYLLFVWLAAIGFRQNHFYILPNFGQKCHFFHYIINQKQNNFIKHWSPHTLISEMCIYIKSSLCKWGLATRVGGGGSEVCIYIKNSLCKWGFGYQGGGGRCSIDKKSKGCRLTTHKIH